MASKEQKASALGEIILKYVAEMNMAPDMHYWRQVQLTDVDTGKSFWVIVCDHQTDPPPDALAHLQGG